MGITTFYPPYSFGGDAVFVERLSCELARRGHHVEVIHCEDSYRLLARGNALGAAREYPGVVVHRLKSPLGWLSPVATQQTGYPLFKSRALLDDPPYRNALGERAREALRSHRTPEAYLARHLGLVEALRDARQCREQRVGPG